MWRPIAISLLAANVLFLAWALWVGDSRPQTKFAAQTAQAAPAALQPARPAAPPRCVRLGPFADPNVAATVAQRLLAAGLAPTAQQDRLQQRDGYWVFVVTADVTAQRRLLAQVRRAGTQDAFAMQDDAQFRVSFGIYSDRARAEQRANGLKPLGIQPQVEEHFQEHAVQWLDVPGAGEQLSASRLEGFGVTDNDIGAFDCPASPPATQ